MTMNMAEIYLSGSFLNKTGNLTPKNAVIVGGRFMTEQPLGDNERWLVRGSYTSELRLTDGGARDNTTMARFTIGFGKPQFRVLLPGLTFMRNPQLGTSWMGNVSLAGARFEPVNTLGVPGTRFRQRMAITGEIGVSGMEHLIPSLVAPRGPLPGAGPRDTFKHIDGGWYTGAGFDYRIQKGSNGLRAAFSFAHVFSPEDMTMFTETLEFFHQLGGHSPWRLTAGLTRTDNFDPGFRRFGGRLWEWKPRLGVAYTWGGRMQAPRLSGTDSRRRP
ncbi:MAG: hypothetical protein ACE5IP_01995 [Terriglobia bacterium]